MEQAQPYDQSAHVVDPSGRSQASSESNALQYASFWQRLGAHLVDMGILLPLTIGTMVLANEIRLFHVYWFLPSLAFGLFYSVYLVQRFGGTPGKLILKMRIALVDGTPVTTMAAFLRHSVLFVISIFSGIVSILAVLSVTDEAFEAMGTTARMQVTSDYSPALGWIVVVLVQVWIWSEFITMLLNKRRRAIHDYIAGTVVVRNG